MEGRVIIVLSLLFLSLGIGGYILYRHNQAIVPGIIPLTGPSPSITGNVNIPLTLVNGTTLYVDGSYTCWLNANCTYSLTPPSLTATGPPYTQAVTVGSVGKPVKLQLNSTNFNFSTTDGGDVYFLTGGGDPIYYWVEYWNSTSQQATLWLLPTSTDVYMYYGSGSNAYSSYNSVNAFLLPSTTVSVGDSNPDGVAVNKTYIVQYNGPVFWKLYYNGVPRNSYVNLTLVSQQHTITLMLENTYNNGYVQLELLYQDGVMVKNRTIRSSGAYYNIEYPASDTFTLHSDGTISVNGLGIAVQSGFQVGANITVILTVNNKVDEGKTTSGYVNIQAFKPTGEPASIDSTVVQSGITSIGGVARSVPCDGKQHVITYTPSVAIKYVATSAEAFVSPPNNGKLLYNGLEYVSNITISPEQAWNDNIVYAIGTDPLDMYYVSTAIPVVKAAAELAGGNVSSVKINVTPIEAKNTTLPGNTTIIYSGKLKPGTNVIDLHSLLDSDVLYYMPNVTVVVQAGQDITLNPRQYWSNRILTGYITLTNNGNIDLSNIMFVYVITDSRGNVLDSRQFPIQATVAPGDSIALMLDQYTIPLPPPGKYKLYIGFQYDPDNTLYALTSRQMDIVVGYKLDVLTSRYATVKVVGSGDEQVSSGTKHSFILAPGTYNVYVNGQLAKQVSLYGDTTLMVNVTAPPPQLPAHNNNSTTLAVALALAIALLAVAVVVLG